MKSNKQTLTEEFSDPNHPISASPGTSQAPNNDQEENEETQSSRRRKIVVCCDGTLSSDIKGGPFTNVSRLARCIAPEDALGTIQLVLYQRGIGTGTSRLTNLIEGATGRGLYENIQEGYSFICHNHTDRYKDEIHLLGFSRGAFTVRAIAQLINDVGLLTKRGLPRLRGIFHSWKHGDRAGVARELQGLEMRHMKKEIRIKTCAVWDTVSSFGLPLMGFLPRRDPRKLNFVNSDICPNIDHAIQALSLYEHRRTFQPIVWVNSNTAQTLKQCWFLGFHSDIGGGKRVGGGLAHIPMFWIMDQLRDHLDLRMANLWEEISQLKPLKSRKKQTKKVQDWNISLEIPCLPEKTMRVGFRRVLPGLRFRVRESMRGVHKLGGSRTRRPCQYIWKEQGIELVKDPNVAPTTEEIHSSVRALLVNGVVVPSAELMNAEVAIIGKAVIWTFKTKQGGITYPVVEAQASPGEIALLREWITHAETYIGSKDLTVSLNRAVSEVESPSKNWSAAKYREEIRWRKVKRFTTTASV